MVNITTFLFPRFSENTYIVFDETKECLIIDPGCYSSEEQQELTDFISYLQLKPKLVINTHCHVDHVIGNKFIMEQYGIQLALHEKEVRFLGMMPNYGKKIGLTIEPIPENYLLLEEGDNISVGNSTFKVLLTPGHSPASISLFCAEEKILISGDVLFKNRIGRIDLPGGNFDVLEKCIKEKIFPLGDDITIYPGHGPSTNIGYEKENNSFVCNWI